MRRSILITGCSSGIGLNAATTLHERGYSVIATARRPEDVSRLQQLGLFSVPLDLADSQSIRDAVSATLEHTGGRLDALFNNGGYGQYGAVEDLHRGALRAQFETNVFGTHELSNLVIPTMRAQRSGRIVITSSVLGLVALPYRGAYSASKFAIEALADTLRLEMRGSGIAVSLIEPGPIQTAFGRNAETHFLANIDLERAGPNQRAYQTILSRLHGESDSTAGRFRLGPEAVVTALIHALESRRPKPRYAVTRPAQAFTILRRLLPTPLLDRLATRQR